MTIEGGATALAVVGAAIGYLVNLARGWRRERRDANFIGTRLLILEVLERHPFSGLSEDELWNAYRSEALAERRKY